MPPGRPTPPEHLFEIAEAAESLGLDSIWMGDHIAFHGGHFTEITATLSAFAARCERLMVGTAVYLLPLRTPGVAAQAVTFSSSES